MKFKIFKHTLAAFRFDDQVLSFHSAFASKSALFKPRFKLRLDGDQDALPARGRGISRRLQ
jgi:hypothetical protein